MSNQPSRQASTEKVLAALMANSPISCAVVASEHGLPLATAGQPNTEMMAAVAAAIKDLAERAHQDLTEITMRDDQGTQIVSRYFSIDKEPLLLAVKLPAGSSYRRETNKAIRKIQDVWST